MAPKVQQPAPVWENIPTVFPGGKIGKSSLSDYKGQWVFLFFYPLDFTFVCPTEICAFSDNVEKFKALKCQVLGCSVDSEYTHVAWCNTARNKGGLGPMEIPLIADLTRGLCKKYDCLIDAGHACRATFLIDP